jgi:hypothetical protein
MCRVAVDRPEAFRIHVVFLRKRARCSGRTQNAIGVDSRRYLKWKFHSGAALPMVHTANGVEKTIQFAHAHRNFHRLRLTSIHQQDLRHTSKYLA